VNGSRETSTSRLTVILDFLLIILVLVWLFSALFGHRILMAVHESRLAGMPEGASAPSAREFVDNAIAIFIRTFVPLFSLAALALGSLAAARFYRAGQYARSVLQIYLAVTASVSLYIATILYFAGIAGFTQVFLEGPLSSLNVTLYTVAFAWLLIGSLLYIVDRKLVDRGNFLQIAGFYLIAFLYLNFLRERSEYGDVSDYVRAAFNLYNGEPFHPRYIYPPLLAVCLKPLVPLGAEFIRTALMILNYLSLLLFYVLLGKTLRKYDFPKNAAWFLAALILLVNVPVLRNLGYVQVNLHIANLMLLTLLLFERYPFFSALALSLAVHLKISPIILVLAFLLARQWRWLTWFLVITFAITGLTILTNGYDCYISSFQNLATLLNAQASSYRDNSIDSFVRTSLFYFGLGSLLSRPLILVLKLGVLVISLRIMWCAVRMRLFCREETVPAVVLNSFIVLILLMMMLSPLVWAHHLVLIIFPFLVMLKRLSRPLDWMLYLAAWALIFVIPVFDFYPFSYKNLFAVVLCYILLIRFLRNGADEPDSIRTLDRGLAGMLNCALAVRT